MEVIQNVKKILRTSPRIEKIARNVYGKLVTAKKDKELLDKYQLWLKENDVTQKELALQKIESKKFKYRPLISVAVPTYNTKIVHLQEAILSVLEQTYENWELILVDDASTNDDVREVIKKFAEKDNRIKYKFLKSNKHIANATNEAIMISTGEFVSLLDHDDILYSNALYEIVKLLNDNKDLDFIYTDQDGILEDTGVRIQPFFKPPYNQDLLWSINCITHLPAIRKSTLVECGLVDDKYNGAQDWELFLRIARSIPKNRISHIPKVLYGWRVHDASTARSLDAKPYVYEAQERALNEDMRLRGYNNVELKRDDMYSAQWRLRFVTDATPKVSIVFCGVKVSKRKLQELQLKTAYSNYEIVVIGKNDTYKDIIKSINGDFVVLANRAIRAKNASWISDMLGDAMRNDIGCVFPKADKKTVMENLKAVLGEKQFQFVSTASRRSNSTHYYLTCRYDINLGGGEVAMVSAKKLQLINPIDQRVQLPEIGACMTKLGYTNLYNPYIKC